MRVLSQTWLLRVPGTQDDSPEITSSEKVRGRVLHLSSMKPPTFLFAI